VPVRTVAPAQPRVTKQVCRSEKALCSPHGAGSKLVREYR
jgi:hypothetical protein